MAQTTNNDPKQPTIRIQFGLVELQAVDVAITASSNLVPASAELFQAVAKIKKALAPYMTSSYAGYVAGGAAGVVGISPNAATMQANKQSAELDKIMGKIMNGMELTSEEQAAYDASMSFGPSADWCDDPIEHDCTLPNQLPLYQGDFE